MKRPPLMVWASGASITMVTVVSTPLIVTSCPFCSPVPLPTLIPDIKVVRSVPSLVAAPCTASRRSPLSAVMLLSLPSTVVRLPSMKTELLTSGTTLLAAGASRRISPASWSSTPESTMPATSRSAVPEMVALSFCTDDVNEP